MSYHNYTTEGIVLKRRPAGEANIVVHILTLELGLIVATAQAARAPSSKLRATLQEYNHVSVTCIKGKNGWKITNVADKGSFFFGAPKYTRKVIAQISSVLLQMIPGEAPHPEIYNTVSRGFEFLENVEEGDVQSFETLLVLRILSELGYVVRNEVTEKFLKGEEWSDDLLTLVREQRISLISIVNKALKESQL